MCGIAGVLHPDGEPVEDATLLSMARSLQHRGPDGYGIYTWGSVGFAHTRLSIVDLEHGDQPMGTAGGRLHVVFNGEIFNHRELRRTLEGRGHRFRTRSDTEVLLHGYQEWGAGLLDRLNGQFAFAIHDAGADAVFLARDRFGIRPLFYALPRGSLVFASEAKGLFASGLVDARLDPEGLDEVFTFWGARPPRTVFRGVRALEPGCLARWYGGRLSIRRYYRPDFPERHEESPLVLAELDDLVNDSVRLRMRADVPVGAYLSGGLDSSVTATLAGRTVPHRIRTYSIAFDDPNLDEGLHQALVAEHIRSVHRIRLISASDVAEVFPEVVWHTETPLVRTAPAPMYLLSRLTREHGTKVVLTGEGADEVFLGYDLFKETRVRDFCLRRPDSPRRRLLFQRLYPYLDPSKRRGPFWSHAFLDAGSPSDPLFSHLPRIRLTSAIKHFYADGQRAALRGFDAAAQLRAALPGDFPRWSLLNRAAYLEFTTLLSPYLLSSQGDRVAMAHGVEGRFPFLDHTLFEFAAALPVKTKLNGLREKDVLRRWAKGVVPQPIRERPKQPYRAPDAPAFFGPHAPSYVGACLDPAEIRRIGIFEADAVSRLTQRGREGHVTGFGENQALVAVLSTQLWHKAFLERAWSPDPLPLAGARVVLRGSAPALEDHVLVF